MMKAMIFAAGYGTRLKPLTDTTPKALIEVAGKPMLESVIRRLIKYDIRDIIINVHHFANKIIDFLKQNDNFGINIQISEEEEILGTGGGLKQAAFFFETNQSFLIHNVDILTNMDLATFLNHHQKKQHLATLAVKKRETSRYFLVDQNGLIRGHVNKKENKIQTTSESPTNLEMLAFSGLHIISPKVLPHLTEQGNYSIIDVYLKLIEYGFPIGVYRMDQFYWKDLGTAQKIKEAESDISDGKIKID